MAVAGQSGEKLKTLFEFESPEGGGATKMSRKGGKKVDKKKSAPKGGRLIKKNHVGVLLESCEVLELMKIKILDRLKNAKKM